MQVLSSEAFKTTSLQVLQLPWEELISRLLELAESEGADEIVVGLPLQLGTGNESSNQARKSRTFAERLAIAADARWCDL